MDGHFFNYGYQKDQEIIELIILKPYIQELLKMLVELLQLTSTKDFFMNFMGTKMFILKY